MRFQHIEPHPLLKASIEKMWIFESSGRMPADDMKLIVPNGRIKLTVPFRNALVADIDGKSYFTKEHSITLTGLVDKPLILDADKDAVTGTIGIEFSPSGAYRLFHLQLSEVRNQICALADVLGNTARQLEEQIANAESNESKISILQQFLIKQFYAQQEDPIFEYCIEKILSSKGKITVKDLEKKTGYSSRWLNMKFTEKLGVSPKNLSSIIRFRQYYQSFAGNTETAFMQNEFYDYYYDPSHFLKEFKRFTGLSYKGFQNRSNDFGKIFYRE